MLKCPNTENMICEYFNGLDVFQWFLTNHFDWIFDVDNVGVHDTVTTNFNLTYFLTLDASHRRFTDSKLDERDTEFRLSINDDSKIQKRFRSKAWLPIYFVQAVEIISPGICRSEFGRDGHSPVSAELCLR